MVIAFQTMPEMSNRYIEKFVNQLPTAGVESPYYRAMVPGILAFEQAPVFGIGTGISVICVLSLLLAEGLDCHPHPHNFYIQMAGETGIIGLITGTIFLWSIIWSCFLAWAGERM